MFEFEKKQGYLDYFWGVDWEYLRGIDNTLSREGGGGDLCEEFGEYFWRKIVVDLKGEMGPNWFLDNKSLELSLSCPRFLKLNMVLSSITQNILYTS